MTSPQEITATQQILLGIGDALQYPVDNQGRRYDVRFLIPMLAYHLARAGLRIMPEAAVIKPRRLTPRPGVIDDAIEWVALDAPNSIDDELAGATVDDIGRLSPAARAEFIRRLGGDGTKVDVPEPDADLDARTPWHVQTHIVFEPEETGL
jgi:hypothetical protein